MTAVNQSPSSLTTYEVIDNDDQTRTVKVKLGKIEFPQWGLTLPESEKAEFLRITEAHENFVKAAEQAGDVIITKDGKNVTLVWKSYEVHCRWIATMAPEDHEQYLDYWRRYRESI